MKGLAKEAKILRRSWQERGDEINRLDSVVERLTKELAESEDVNMVKWWSGWEMGYRCCLEDAVKMVREMPSTSYYGGYDIGSPTPEQAYSEAIRKRLKRSLARRQGRKGK